MKIGRIISIAILFLFLSSSITLIHGPNNSAEKLQLASGEEMSYTSNTAYLNSTMNYYTESANTSLQNLTISPKLKTSPESWYFNQEPIGTTQVVDSHLMFNVGDYQYWAGSPVGDQSYTIGNLVMEPNFALGFYAGIDSNGKANIGTVYATLVFSGPNTGKEVANYTWSDSISSTYTGDSQEIFIYPHWDPIISTGYYNISLYVGVTPNTNYVSGNPYDLFTTQSGVYPNGLSEDFPMYGWTYSGITDGFPITVPNNTSAFQFSYDSSEPVQADVGGITSSQSYQNNITLYSTSYKSGQFQNVLGNPNVLNITVSFHEINIIAANSSPQPTITSSSLPYQNLNWFNSTYVFTTHAPNGAMNGMIVDGKQWNTSWYFEISHVEDYNFNASSPTNFFYINGNFVASPKLYNIFSSNSIDSNNLTTLSFTCLGSDLFNYYPVLVSSYESNSTVFATQPLTVIINTSENVSGEQAQVNLQWGDGSQNISSISSAYTYSFTHTYLKSGNYTPTVSIVNFPNGPSNTSLSTLQTPIGRIEVKSIPISFSASRTGVNPHEPLSLTVNTTAGILPQSDKMFINYGDNNTTIHTIESSFVLNTSYNAEGIYSPFVEITSSGNVVAKVYGPKITVSPIEMSTSNKDIKNIEHLLINYSSLSEIRDAALYVDGKEVKTFAVDEFNGSLYYNYTYIKNYVNETMYGNTALWVLETYFGYSQNSSNYYTPPVITNLSAGSNPTWVGDQNYFNFDVYYVNNVYSTNQNGVKLYVNDQRINWQDPYYFNQTGNYTVTLIANNSYGNASYSYVQEVLPNNPIVSSVSASSNPVQPGTTVTFSANVDWQGQVGSLQWNVNGEILKGDSYNFTYPGNYTVSALATNSAGFNGAWLFEIVNTIPPKINKIVSDPLKVTSGNTVSFDANVTWYQVKGTINWQVDGSNITGNYYTFSSPGNYTVTAIAQNSYGIANRTITIDVVKSTPPNFTRYIAIGGGSTAIVVAIAVAYFLKRKH
jgi:PKD repeat protein